MVPFNVALFGVSTFAVPVTTVGTALSPLPLTATFIVFAPPPPTGILPL